MRDMRQQVEEKEREAVLVEDAVRIRMMGFPILEALPSRGAPYEQVDPFILVHEGRMRLSDMQGVDTKHPHRGFDNLWYAVSGSASTGHSTGPDGAMERHACPREPSWRSGRAEVPGMLRGHADSSGLGAACQLLDPYKRKGREPSVPAIAAPPDHPIIA